MNLRKLIDFFPYTYKERDTYKVNGQGILERFLEICGTYLEEYITPDIENELELIDLDKVPKMYLNYLWEYLGSIPFAYGVSIDKDKFDKYYNGLKSKEELEALSKVWIIQKKGPVVLNETKVRNILKYAITLTKIRGTKRFFETIFKLYGFECKIVDPSVTKSMDEVINYLFRNDVSVVKYDDGSIAITRDGNYDKNLDDTYFRANYIVSDVVDNDDYYLAIADSEGNVLAYRDAAGKVTKGSTNGLTTTFDTWLDDKPICDSEYYKYDTARFDDDPRCSQCVEVYFDISCVFGFMDKNSEYCYDSRQILFTGKYDGLFNLYEGVHEYNGVITMAMNQDDFVAQNARAIVAGSVPASLNDFKAFRKMVAAFFDRYLPYNVIPHVTYQGCEVIDAVEIDVLPSQPYDSNRPNTIFRGVKDYVEYVVNLKSVWPLTDLRFVISGDGKTWGNPHENYEVIKIYTTGKYYFKPVTSSYTGDPLEIEVTEVMLNTWYSLSHVTPDGTEFGPGVSSLRVCLKAIKHVEYLDTDDTIKVRDTQVPVTKILGNTKISPSQWVEDPTYKVWTFGLNDTDDGLGIQKVSFAIQESVNKSVTFQFTRVPEYAFASISPTSINADNKSTKVVTCYPQTNYGDDELYGYIGLKCRENGLIYGWEDQWTINRDGVTHFEVVRIFNGDIKHDTRANSIIIENTPEHPTKCNFSVVRTTPLTVWMSPTSTKYLTDSNPTALVSCWLRYYGTLPPGIEFNWNLKVFEDGVDTGVVINGYNGQGTYEVSKGCTITYVSLQDTTVRSNTSVVDNRTIQVTRKLVISPEMTGQGTWDTHMWQTDWSNSNEKSSATAKNGSATFKLTLYTEQGMVIGETVEVQDTNWNVVSRVETGSLVTLNTPGTYHLVHTKTNLKAELVILAGDPSYNYAAAVSIISDTDDYDKAMVDSKGYIGAYLSNQGSVKSGDLSGMTTSNGIPMVDFRNYVLRPSVEVKEEGGTIIITEK